MPVCIAIYRSVVQAIAYWLWTSAVSAAYAHQCHRSSTCPGGQRAPPHPTAQHRIQLVRRAMVIVADKAAGRVADPVLRPVGALGDFFAMTLDTSVCMFKPPFAWREYLLQCWFVARVSTLPGVLMTIPWAVISGFLFNVLLTDIGAADFSGTGCAIFTVNQSRGTGSLERGRFIGPQDHRVAAALEVTAPLLRS